MEAAVTYALEKKNKSVTLVHKGAPLRACGGLCRLVAHECSSALQATS